MSETVEGTVRRMWRIGVIVGLISVAGALAGCSAAEATSAYSGADPANPQFAGAGGDAAKDVVGAPAAAPASTADRSIIITGAMYMTVEDPIAAADRAVGIVLNAGGRVDARSEAAPGERDGGSAALKLRIPSNRLDAVVGDLRKLGTVDQFNTDSYDVTTQVTDLESQISTLRASTARIEGLLSAAKDISDIITLENELDGRQARLESLEAQQRGLTDQVSMSTIDLSLTTEPVVIVETDGPQSFWGGLKSGWSGLVGFLSGAAVVVGVLLPWIALMALVALAVVVAVRVRKSRVARKAEASTATQPSQNMQPPSPASAKKPAARR